MRNGTDERQSYLGLSRRVARARRPCPMFGRGCTFRSHYVDHEHIRDASGGGVTNGAVETEEQGPRSEFGTFYE